MNDESEKEIFHCKLFILSDVFTLGVCYCSVLLKNNLKQRITYQHCQVHLIPQGAEVHCLSSRAFHAITSYVRYDVCD